ncbi:MAG: tetratricopeptide repeat protein, partial [Terriglobales bacterium]
MSPKVIAFVAMLWMAATAVAADKGPNYLQVHSPHFFVVTDASEKQARNVADQFERMRAVFHDSFPNLAIDEFGPITVLAVRNEKEFRTMVPSAYLAKGSLKLAGYFLRVPEKNYILVRLDAQGDEHPFSVVYHEYTHLLTSKGAEWMPLWMNEGLAQFYETTEIEGKDVLLGKASFGTVEVLRENKLIPLPILFAVDHNSPYYHREDKGSVFYAESWALTHMLFIDDFKTKANRVRTYMMLLANHVDPVQAAAQAFGDLGQLQKALESYIRQDSFQYFHRDTQISTKDLEYRIEPLPVADADAARADILAYNERTDDAHVLLQQVLQEDPKNVSARETLGYLAVRAGNLDEARKWYEEAVKLDSQSYLANYNYAALEMNAAMDEEQVKSVENSLRAAIKANPKFAPAYDRLAVLLAMHDGNLDEAHLMSLYAVSNAPDVAGFRLNSANILMKMRRVDDAVRVIEAARNVATTDQEKMMVENALAMAKNYQARLQQRQPQTDEQVTVTTTDGPPPVLRHRTESDQQSVPATYVVKKERPFPPPGPHKFADGAITDVQCAIPAVLDFHLSSGTQPLTM